MAKVRGGHMKTPSYIKVEIKGTGNKLFANIKVRRWGWGWMAFSRTQPERWRYYPVWFVMCLWITIKGLAGKYG